MSESQAEQKVLVALEVSGKSLQNGSFIKIGTCALVIQQSIKIRSTSELSQFFKLLCLVVSSWAIIFASAIESIFVTKIKFNFSKERGMHNPQSVLSQHCVAFEIYCWIPNYQFYRLVYNLVILFIFFHCL